MNVKDLKVCIICKQEKPIAEFNKNKAKKDGVGVDCRVCSNKASRQYYALNKQKHKLAVRLRKISNKKLLQTYVYNLLKTTGCVDCKKENDPVALEFDHVRGTKRRAVCELIARNCSFSSILKEIEKCEIRCSNCHRKKTAKDQNWYADIK